MNEIYLPFVMFLAILSGYFVSKGASEELKELAVYLNYTYIITASLVFGVAAYFNMWIAILVTILIFCLLYFYNGRTMQNVILFVSGVLLSFVKELFVFSVVLFINMMMLASINYEKRFIKNVVVYLYFLIPALIVYLIKFFLRV